MTIFHYIGFSHSPVLISRCRFMAKTDFFQYDVCPQSLILNFA